MRSIALVMLLLLPAEVCAQDRTATLSAADREEARALFAAGSAAVDEGRWADAVESFERAYALTGVPSALFNTAFALRALGRYRESAEAFDRLLAIESISESVRAEATGLRDEVRARIARIRLTGLAPAPHAIRLDGAPSADRGDRPLSIDADPGRRVLDVEREGFQPYEWSGTLSDGEVLDLHVTLSPLATGGSSIVEEPWLWIAIGGAVAVIAGAILIGYADDQAQLRPESPVVFRL